MSEREVDVDALFERNADTQLLDRRRRDELGLAAQVAPSSSTAVRFGPESIVGDIAPPPPRAAMLRVALDARPERELIPGAVVTVVVSVYDDGEADAHDVLLRVAVPTGCEPILDSFARDDAALDGDALLGEGLRIGSIEAGDAVRVRFAMRVLPGTEPLDVLAHASAPGVPAIAAPSLRLTRRAGHTAFDSPRPFFELEAGETDDALTEVTATPEPQQHAVDTVLDEPAAPEIMAAPEVVEAPEDIAAQDVVTVPEAVTVPEVVIAPEVVTPPEIVAKPPDPVVVVRPFDPAIVVVNRAEPMPQLQPEPEPEPAPKQPPARKKTPRAEQPPEPERPYILARTLDVDDIRAHERIFAGAIPHGLAALALLSSIATVESPLGEALGLRDFARTIAAAVPRALVAARMNRPVPPVVTREALDTIRAFASPPDEPFAHYFPMLVTRLDERELGALRTVLARDLDDPFLRGTQVLLAVMPRALDGVRSDVSAAANEALAAYRITAGAWLMRVTVRRAVDRGYDPIVANDASMHEAGRALVTALRAALPPGS
jgi:hypothetical protein